MHGAVWIHTLLRPTEPPLPFAQLVADGHEHLPEAALLPGRKHEDAREVVVVPAHLLLAEEADDLRAAAGRVREDQQVVQEGRHVVEDGFCVEEQLREEGEVLRVELGGKSGVGSRRYERVRRGTYLVLFAVNFVDGEGVLRVDECARRCGTIVRADVLPPKCQRTRACVRVA